MARSRSSPSNDEESPRNGALGESVQMQLVPPSAESPESASNARHSSPNPLADLRKPVEAIVITPQKRKLTLLSRRFFNVMLRHAQQNPVAPGEYHEISLAQFIQDARYASRNMEHLAEVLECLTGTSVTWGDSPKNLKGPKYERTSASLVSLARLRKLEGQAPVLQYDFQKEVRDLLLNHRVYASISLSMNATMKTQPALVLYELGVRYLTNKNGLTMRMPWRDWVAPITGNPSVSADLEYKYFARDVLKPALREVNDAQDEFEMLTITGKVARKVETLQFQVVRKTASTATPAPSPLAGLETEDLFLIDRMLKLKIGQETAEKLVRQYGTFRTQLALDAVEKAGDAVRAPLPYLRTVLEKGDFPDAPIDVESRPAPHSAMEDGHFQSWKKGYLAHMRDRALEVYLEGSSEHQLEYLDKFEEEQLPSLNTALQRSWKEFRAQWPARRMTNFIAVPFKTWLASAYSEPTEDEVVEWASRSGLIQVNGDGA